MAVLPMVWIDGGLTHHGDAQVVATDHGLTVGDGVFETLKVTAGVPFALHRHLARLEANAAVMGIAAPDPAELRAAAQAVAEANPAATKLRLTVTSGDGPAGSGRGDGAATMVVYADDTPLATGPVHLVTAPWTRNERGALAGLKTTSYAENVLALRHARAAGADEAVFANTRDELCEGTGTNIFVVLDDRLITPPLSSGCLAGITRALVLEATDAVEAPVVMADMTRVSEAFVTSSTRDVQPVATLDGRDLAVIDGPVTREAAAAFARVAANPDP